MAKFEDLEVWKKAVELSASIYIELRELKDFGFRDQITRAGLSVPSNIAEGLERFSPADQIKFLDYARASCAEVRTQTIVGKKVGFITESVADSWIPATREISAMIQGLIRSIHTRNNQ